MAISEYALALTTLLGTLLVPFFVLYKVIRLRRRAIRVTDPVGTPSKRR